MSFLCLLFLFFSSVIYDSDKLKDNVRALPMSQKGSYPNLVTTVHTTNQPTPPRYWKEQEDLQVPSAARAPTTAPWGSLASSNVIKNVILKGSAPVLFQTAKW